jgi:hypothetical protein
MAGAAGSAMMRSAITYAGGTAMEVETVKQIIAAYMEKKGMGAAQLAQFLHPDITTEDVSRFLAGEPAVREEEREITVSSIMYMFADSLSEDE